jgi:hypothetical protein
MAIDPSVRARVSLAGLVRAARAARRRSDRGAVAAVIPAHSDEDRIERAIWSLDAQGSPPDVIVVCVEDGTYRTRAKAEALGAHVFEGGLGEVLPILLTELHDEDAVLVIEPHSILAPTFLAEAMRRLRGRMGGVVMGSSFVALIQRNGQVRSARRLGRLNARGTLFAVGPLRHVIRTCGEVVESNELTVALLRHDYDVVAVHV